MRKKGVLFTLGLLLLVSTILLLSMIMFHNMQSIERIFIDASSIDKLHDVHSSIENSLKEIFAEESGITITISPSEDYVIIEENLSNLKAEGFKNTMAGFKTFVESNFGEATLNINDVKNTMPLIIKPHNINYTHMEGYGISKKVEITPSAPDVFNAYIAYIYSHKVNVTGIVWEDFTPGSITVQIIAEDSEGNYFTGQKDVETVDARVSLLTGGPVNLVVDSDGKLEITNTADSNVLVRTRIDLPPSATQKLKVTYPENVVRLAYDDFDLSKESDVMLA